jgi:sigma-B regulation protein RsbU (phosphoserine phosphatase)
MEAAAQQPMYDAERVSGVIFRYASLIGAEQDTDRLLELNADMARDISGADRCSIWLRDERRKELWTKVAHGTKEIRVPEGAGLVGACISSNGPVVVNDVKADKRFFQKVDTSSGYVTQSVLALPLRGASGKVIGVLQVLNKPGGFTPFDVDMLGLAASYGASTLETQRLRQEAEATRVLYRELEIARDVQQKLLPQKFPSVPGLDYAGHCRPARAVGGDYYDFCQMDDGRFVVTLGDVSGKGIAAALMMAGIHSSLRTQMLMGVTSLAEQLSVFNSAIYISSPPDKYSTLFVGIIDAERRELTYVNAGQVMPMLVRHGKLLRLEESGVPVGLLPSWKYEQTSVPLEKGDLLVCFSDGISEAENAQGEFWEEKRAGQVTSKCTGMEVITHLFQGCDEFAAGFEQSDDITVIAVHVQQ